MRRERPTGADPGPCPPGVARWSPGGGRPGVPSEPGLYNSPAASRLMSLNTSWQDAGHASTTSLSRDIPKIVVKMGLDFRSSLR